MQAQFPLAVETPEAALAAAPFGMFICDGNGTFQTVNAALEKLTGLSADELVGRRGFESLHDPAELARRRAELPCLAAIGARYEGEWTYRRRSGTPVRVVLALSPLSPPLPPLPMPGAAARPECAP